MNYCRYRFKQGEGGEEEGREKKKKKEEKDCSLASFNIEYEYWIFIIRREELQFLDRYF